MPTRSRVLFAALFTGACLIWLAPCLREDSCQQGLAFQGATRGGLADTHAPGDVGPIDAPIAAPTRAGRAAAVSTTADAAVEPSGLVVRLRDPAGAALGDVSVRFAAVGTARTLAQSLNRYVRTDTGGEARLSAREVEALFGAESDGRVFIRCFDELSVFGTRVTIARQPLPVEPIDLGACATESNPHGGAPARRRCVAARFQIASSYEELAAPCGDAPGHHPTNRLLWRRLLEVDVVPVHVGALLRSGERWLGQLGVSWHYKGGGRSSTGGASPVRIWVGRGEAYLVRVSGAGLYEPVEASYPAITALERERAHDLQLDKALAGLRATLLTPDGVPLPEHRQIELRTNRNEGDGDESSTRVEGELRFRVNPALNAAQQRTVWLVALGRGPLGHGRWRKQVTYDAPPAGEWTDLGEVTLEAEPLLVAGHVVTPDGVPLCDIGVEVESVDSDGRWARLPDLGNCVWLDEAGAFAIHGPAPDAPLRVRAVLGFRNDLDGHAAVLPPLTAPGSTDVVVRIVEAGAVRFHVAGGDDLSYDQLDIRSMPEGDTEPRALGADEVRNLVEAEADGTYVVRRLPPGEISITPRAELGAVAIGEPLYAAVRAGETTDAGALVLDDRVRWVELTVTEHPWASADIVRYGPHGGALTLRAEVQANGVARLGLRASGGVDVVVGGDSLAPVFLAEVRAPCTVALSAFPAVTFEVAGLIQLAAALGEAAGGRALVVQLTPLDGEPWAALAEPALLRRQRFDVSLDEVEHMHEAASIHIAPARYSVAAAIVPRAHAHERWLGPEHGFRSTALGELEVVPDLSTQTARIQVDSTLR